MFGKIKDRLKNVFKASDEVIEKEDEEKVEEIKKEELEIKEVVIDNSKKSKKKIPKKDKVKSKSKSKKDISNENKVELDKKEEVEEKNIIEKELEVQIPEEIEEILDNKEDKKGLFNMLFKKKVEVLIDGDSQNEENSDSGVFSKTIDKLKSKTISKDDFDKIWLELQIFLLEINIAFEIVEKIEVKLRLAIVGNSFNRFKLSLKIREVLEEEVEKVLKEREGNLLEKILKIKEKDGLVKILILGVNGTGKTTTIAKVVNYLQNNNLKVVVAAADTFRAAATEQLEEHSKKLNFKLISHKGGSDPAAVSFDAIEHAKAKNLDIVLIDTAGRMPNNSNLMCELEKIKRVSSAQISIFVGDSISGNDLIDQIHLFNSGVKVDGVILTKVDTDEKPGSVVTTAYSIDRPIYFLGVGQEYKDLILFNGKEISKKLFDLEDD